ncbi:succinate dehydrogenase [ubiquinone] cytochrome b small subunit, mitochondrial [Euwallacea similis]|uniref:succinate dehydrogenase [ubiquinone] cytochrome b small subunit, mitochondrial n=1 Tax=Euwallacea similis TaxID=1736056 RepID=UPI00344FE4C6
MALSLMLRNSPKLRGLPCTFNRLSLQVPKTRTFTHLTAKPNSVSLATKCKTQFFKIVEQRRNMSADHSKLWSIEKLVSILLLGVVPTMFIYPNKILDNIFSVAVVMHFHWGVEACVVDYVRPIVFGPVIPKLTLGLLYLVSASTLAALIYFNQHQIGIGATVRKFWCITGTAADNGAKN